MPKPTVRRLLNEAQNPGGSYDVVALDLYMGVETRPTEYVVEITEDDGEAKRMAEELLLKAAGHSGYSVEKEHSTGLDPVFRLTCL
jgi:hypothetical protein